MRFVLAAALLAGLVSPVVADDKAKKEEAKPEDKKLEVVKCQIVKAGDKDVAPPVDVDYTTAFKSKTKVAMTPAVAKPLCKSQAAKPAGEWGRDNGLCATKKTFKYTVSFGVEGKEEKIELNGICAKPAK